VACLGRGNLTPASRLCGLVAGFCKHVCYMHRFRAATYGHKIIEYSNQRCRDCQAPVSPELADHHSVLCIHLGISSTTDWIRTLSPHQTTPSKMHRSWGVSLEIPKRNRQQHVLVDVLGLTVNDAISSRLAPGNRILRLYLFRCNGSA
jgi:hypothetical protein